MSEPGNPEKGFHVKRPLRVPSPMRGRRRRTPPAKNWVRAVGGLSGGVEGDMLRRNDSESSEPLADGIGRHRRHSEGVTYNPQDGEIGTCLRVGRMGPIKRRWTGTL